MWENLKEQIESFFNTALKIMPPFFLAMSLKIAIQYKDNTATLKSVFVQIVVGFSSSMLVGPYLYDIFNNHVAFGLIGLVAIISEQIGKWLVNKFDFSPIGKAATDWIKKKFK